MKPDEILKNIEKTYLSGNLEYELLDELAKCINDVDKKNISASIQKILAEKDNPAEGNYDYTVMFSFALNEYPTPDLIVKFADAVINDSKLSYANIYYIYSRLNHIIFVNPSCNTEEANYALWRLLRKSLEVYLMNNEIDLSPIPAESMDGSMAIVITDQFIGVGHGPTKTALDRAYVLKKRFGKVLIINTCENCPDAGEVPYWVHYKVAYCEEYANISAVEWKGETFNFFQCDRTMPNAEMMALIIQYIRKLRPCVSVCVGGDSFFAGLVNKLIPTVVVGTTQSGIIPTLCDYQFADKLQIDSNEELIRRLGYEDSIIPGRFTFSILDADEKVTRKQFGIPEDAFVVSAVGGRLFEEITDEFWKSMNEVYNDKLYIILIGIYHKKETQLAGLQELYDHVIDMGFCNDAVSRIALSDLYVNPYRKGGATSAVEAMSLGIPILTADYGDVSGVVPDEFIVDGYQDYPKAIEQYILDKEYYKEQSLRAKQQAEIMLDSETEFNRMLDVYLNRL